MDINTFTFNYDKQKKIITIGDIFKDYEKGLIKRLF